MPETSPPGEEATGLWEEVGGKFHFELESIGGDVSWMHKSGTQKKVII
jgi:hypothetical protein